LHSVFVYSIINGVKAGEIPRGLRCGGNNMDVGVGVIRLGEARGKNEFNFVPAIAGQK
jgi:hypothetical protein